MLDAGGNMEFTITDASCSFEQKRDIKTLSELESLDAEFGNKGVIVLFKEKRDDSDDRFGVDLMTDNHERPRIIIYDSWIE